MDDLYSIGDTARIMGISVQTLRNYSNLKLLEPQYIDPETGYRYYSFKQFHYIDRIKYLRRLGLSLPEIAEILEEGKTDKMLAYLEIQKQRIAGELEKIQETYDDIHWYINYFKYLERHHFDNIPYVSHLDKRYVMFVDYLESDTVESVETRLAKLKNSQDLKYRRQYGYIAEFASLVEKKFVANKYFIYLKEKPFDEAKWFWELPAGEYLCFRGKIRTENWNPEFIAEYFKNHKTPPYVIANEYEDNLVEYHNCPYEIQILVTEEK
ncbi:MAG: putative transcriptional regulator [Firmicutes bacterium]|nr:putative transcriptional regulator [Bacillota bacterium]